MGWTGVLAATEIGPLEEGLDGEKDRREVLAAEGRDGRYFRERVLVPGCLVCLWPGYVVRLWESHARIKPSSPTTDGTGPRAK